MEYTYNGLGEFIVSKITNATSDVTILEIQSRTAKAVDANGTVTNATVFTAFVAKDENGGIAQVEMNLNKDGMLFIYS